VNGVLDLFTIVFLSLYVKRPIYLFGSFGFALCILGFFLDLLIVLQGLLTSGRVGHFALLIFGLVSIIFGIQFIFTGLLLEMSIRFHHEQRKESPVYRKI
jgi:hypothetical protein